MDLVAEHLQRNRAHVLRPRALALLNEDFSVFYTDHDLPAREQLLQQVLYVFEMPRRTYNDVGSPRQFALDLQIYMHRLKAIAVRELSVDARVKFGTANYDAVHTIRKALSDFMIQLDGKQIAHPLWLTRV